MRASSQRHLASARGSSLLTWLPRPGRGARSPPALRRCGESPGVPQGCVGMCDPQGPALWGHTALPEPRHGGWGVALPGKGLAQQQGTVLTRGGDNWRLVAS